MDKRTQYLLALILVPVLIVSVYAVLVATRTISNTAAIKTVGVSAWQDSNCTITLTTYDWGTIDPGGSAQKTMYLKNDGNAAITLNMTTGSWVPTNASIYVTVTWNREGAVIPVGNSLQANVTLSVSTGAATAGITSFSFTITITGTA